MSRDASLSDVGEIPDMPLGLSGISVLRQLRDLATLVWNLAAQESRQLRDLAAPGSRRSGISPAS